MNWIVTISQGGKPSKRCYVQDETDPNQAFLKAKSALDIDGKCTYTCSVVHAEVIYENNEAYGQSE